MNKWIRNRVLAHVAVASILPLICALIFDFSRIEKFGVDFFVAFFYLCTGILGVFLMPLESNPMLFRIMTACLRIIIMFIFISYSLKKKRATGSIILHAEISIILCLTGYFILMSVWL